MTVANLVSLFDTEKIIFGGGVFGPATRFLPEIRQEAAKWAQPVSMKMVSIEGTQLHDKAGLYGAGLLALQNLKS
jgi:glucokinase